MESIENCLRELPPEVVIRDQEIISSYTTDFRRQYAGKTVAVLKPRSTADVQLIVKTCARNGVGLVPQGGNTSYCAAATPSTDGSQLVISLERMNQVVEIDQTNLSMIAEAGAILGDLQLAAEDVDLILPLSLGSQGSCRIGGNLSTNAGGVNVVRYGMARDLVMGLEVVLPDGSLFCELSPLRKNNSGYDVKQLFLGAEGTLGVITKVSLKLSFYPTQIVTAFLAVDKLGDLAPILRSAQKTTGEAITSFEYISRTSLALLLEAQDGMRHPLETTNEHYVLLEAATASPVLNLPEVIHEMLGGMIEAGTIVDGTIATSQQQRAQFWHLRENIPEAEVHFGGSIKHDIAVRTSLVAEFIVAGSEIVRSHAENALLSIYGHVGDGNVHFNVVAPSGSDPVKFKQEFERDVSPAIYDLAKSMGGTFSAEYGVGQAKLMELGRYAAPGKLEIMRRLKAAIDPDAIMNPGKVVKPMDLG